MSSLRPIRRVKQQCGTSCGIACVAMLAGISFKDAFRAARKTFPEEEWKNRRTHHEDLRAIFLEMGWKLGRKVMTNQWAKIPPGALVAIQWKPKQERWHWVVSDQDAEGLFFYDPNPRVKALRRRDLEKAPPAWHHRVTKSD